MKKTETIFKIIEVTVKDGKVQNVEHFSKPNKKHVSRVFGISYSTIKTKMKDVPVGEVVELKNDGRIFLITEIELI